MGLKIPYATTPSANVSLLGAITADGGVLVADGVVVEHSWWLAERRHDA